MDSAKISPNHRLKSPILTERQMGVREPAERLGPTQSGASAFTEEVATHVEPVQKASMPATPADSLVSRRSPLGLNVAPTAHTQVASSNLGYEVKE